MYIDHPGDFKIRIAKASLKFVSGDTFFYHENWFCMSILFLFKVMHALEMYILVCGVVEIKFPFFHKLLWKQKSKNLRVPMQTSKLLKYSSANF